MKVHERKLSAEKHESSNRSFRRRHDAVAADSRPYARFRSGIPTGTTPHFRLWMADLALKSTLQKARLVTLAADSRTDSKVAAGYAMLAGKFKTVWGLVNASREDLLKVPGIGPARLRTIHADLTAHNVKTKWSAE